MDPSTELYKVVWTDGFNRETMPEHVVFENLPEGVARHICECLRAGSKWEGNWWVVKRQDAKLWRGMEEFV